MSDEPGPSQQIVAAIDGSESSILALRWAAQQAELTGSALEIIMTWEWPTTYGWALPFPAEYNPAAEAQKVLDHAVEKALAEHPKVAVRSRLIEGHPAPVLVDASMDADMLVVGSRGHGEFAGMLLGSVSEHCTANAHCSVVVVRERR
jgi:nucleotide-binding universal stress UspA family protein